MFSKKCVQILTPDGTILAKLNLPKTVCKETKNLGVFARVHFNLYGVVSDGKKVRPIFFPSAQLALCSLTLLTLVTTNH